MGPLSSLEFINTTATLKIDDSSRWLIRKQASRYAARSNKQVAGGSSIDMVAKPGIKSRFRLGPTGFSDSPKRVRRVEQKAGRGHKAETDIHLLAATSVKIKAQTILNPRRNSFLNPDKRAGEQQDMTLRVLLKSLETSISHAPSAGSWDPFKTTALPITNREQMLLHHYFNGRRQVTSPLIPYCRIFFSLAIQDKACFHAFLSHNSAVYRLAFKEESTEESIRHLMAAIHLITERLEDPKDRYSNGTISTFATLIIYESANGALPNLEHHMNGLEEMVKKRGGFEKAGFPADVKRLITWTDLNAANDLWKPPRFALLDVADSREPSLALPPQLISPGHRSALDEIFREIKALEIDLTYVASPRDAADRYSLATSDKIHVLERSIISLIHAPPESHTPLGHVCANSALIFMRSCLRDLVCNFRPVETARLQRVLVDMGGGLKVLLGEAKRRQKLVWVLSLGVVTSDREDRRWFVQVLGVLCEVLGLARWDDLRKTLGEVLWKDGLDEEGAKAFEEVGYLDRQAGTEIGGTWK